MDILIRKIIHSDYDAISRIYLDGINTGDATFENTVPAWDEWDCKMLPYCRFAAEQNGEILGWAALAPTSSRFVYRGVN